MGYYNRALEFVKEEEVDEFSDEEERETWRRLQMRPNGPYSIIPCANLISKLQPTKMWHDHLGYDHIKLSI
ncbi:hypothetical protein FRC20_000841 [Serendipita sp. 405]|nr:hypothetical protein FRC20_000841 [Serendipita sp. 405]